MMKLKTRKEAIDTNFVFVEKKIVLLIFFGGKTWIKHFVNFRFWLITFIVDKKYMNSNTLETLSEFVWSGKKNMIALR